jgi:hypothetical protein
MAHSMYDSRRRTSDERAERDKPPRPNRADADAPNLRSEHGPNVRWRSDLPKDDLDRQIDDCLRSEPRR